MGTLEYQASYHKGAGLSTLESLLHLHELADSSVFQGKHVAPFYYHKLVGFASPSQRLLPRVGLAP
jgi:hypothetical protein